jgi:undecaprenyl-diphosphatase
MPDTALVLGAMLTVALAAGGLVWAVVQRWPQVDPANPYVEMEEHPAWRRILRARADPQTATGLLLTVAVATVVAGAIAFGVLLAMVRQEKGLSGVDASAAEWAADHATELSTDVLTVVTHFGGTLVVVTLTLIAFAFESRRQPSRALFWFLLLVVAGQSIIANTIKWAVDRARPDFEQLASFSSASFPSGHATTAAATYAALALVLGRGRTVSTRASLAGGAAAIAVAVAATRVLLGVHWVTDVAAGLALGWSWFALCAIAFGGRLLHFGAPLEETPEEQPSQAE